MVGLIHERDGRGEGEGQQRRRALAPGGGPAPPDERPAGEDLRDDQRQDGDGGPRRAAEMLPVVGQQQDHPRADEQRSETGAYDDRQPCTAGLAVYGNLGGPEPAPTEPPPAPVADASGPTGDAGPPAVVTGGGAASVATNEEAFGLERVEDAQDEDIKLIQSRYVGEFTGWDGQTTFPLENGQVWQLTAKGRVRLG